jgi:hypothetical protein
MRHVIATTVLVVGAIASGCSTKPPRDVDAAVRQRLTRFSDAWKQGDAAGVRESFVARDADETALLDAVAKLAPAQATLRKAYYEQLGPIGQKIFGDGDVSKLVLPSTQWERHARDAAHPYALTYKEPDVLVQLDEHDRNTIVPVRNVAGGWKMDIGAFTHGSSVPDLTAATQRQVRQTSELTAVVRTGDTKEIQRVMLKHITENLGPKDHQIIGDILGDGSATRPTTAQTATPTTPAPAPQRSAKENPP